MVKKCTKCGLPCSRATLTVKRIVFQTEGDNARVLKSRVTDHLCADCLTKDEGWNLPSHRMRLPPFFGKDNKNDP